MNNAKKIKKFLLDKIPGHPRDIVLLTANHFNVSRVTVHRHLNYLIKHSKIIQSGVTKNVSYSLAENLNIQLRFSINKNLSEFEIFEQYFENILKNNFNNNIYDICNYGFTEIFNNAIDHSKGSNIAVVTQYEQDNLIIKISDNGIGIFTNILNYLSLTDIRESILHLSKGKFTTLPKYHTGEGIFFCSRAFDKFEIFANGLYYIKDNKEADWGFQTLSSAKKGTLVTMTINAKSKNNLISIFKNYQNPETLAFDKTNILVELAKIGHDTLISRSQAKRIVQGLNKFKFITLDFMGIRIVGQGFVDEVFRVFAHAHPDIKINYVNANEDIEFMITRGLNTNSARLEK